MIDPIRRLGILLRVLRHRWLAFRASWSLWHALGHRGRIGVWGYWVSLDSEPQRELFVALLVRCMHEAWRRARSAEAAPPASRRP